MKDEIAAQAVILEIEKQLQRTAEDKKWRVEEGLRRLQSNMDRLKEEKGTLQ